MINISWNLDQNTFVPHKTRVWKTRNTDMWYFIVTNLLNILLACSFVDCKKKYKSKISKAVSKFDKFV